ncbi:CBL-interacting serine/threonine-protein kinase 4-like [Cajanus cajan]|uniref:CBL-interacting serine/threonine-protein kinase 4-like n=1 Tax=Cajanus cajan TaxID=3821 RepID=UPI0010FAF094|nr:CBL-interacting serine/threonine-protein kinase 4-like [Cajanus cajan]XP_029125838.1 CBL-interacting serine/threonine-protein kinase 4-like [Cajanus cajan]XP_029125839.1 CBL-interacting serine/threonine-protein kinase 4-like [Cajanus cajan]
MEPRIVHEIHAMHRLQHHPNILKIHKVLATKTKIYLIVDFAGGGELFSKLSRRGRLPESLAPRYFTQLVSALRFCHRHGYKLVMNAFDIISMSSGLDLRGLFETTSDKGRRGEKRFTFDKSVETVETKVKEVGLNLGFRVEVGKNGVIGLGWDTVVRFSSYNEILGEGFFADFAQVADDESRQFSWCAQRLAELGFKYGDMPAHNLLWRECEKSSDNVAACLAVIPLVQEARGLDVGPRLVKKLVGFGDNRTSKIVARIACY